MKPDYKDRDYMYRLLIGQLFYDGHQQLARSLAQVIGCSSQPPPSSDKLFHILSIARQFIDDPEKKDKKASIQLESLSTGLDLEYDDDIAPASPEPIICETIYLTHDAPCKPAGFKIGGSSNFATKINDGKREQNDGPVSLNKINKSKDEVIDWKRTSVDPILSKLGVLSKTIGKTEDNQKALLREYQQWLQLLVSNLDIRKSASDIALKRLAEMPKEASDLTTDRLKIMGRLAVLSGDLSNFHNELNKRCQILESLANRFQSLNERASKQRPLTSQEKRVLKTLQDYKKQAISISDNAAMVSINLAEEKRATLGPARSFQPTLASYEASGAKLAREIEFLGKRLDKLTEMVNKAQT